MHNKKVLMHEFNGTDFDNILPQTTIDQVQNLQTSLDGKIAIAQGTDKAGYFLIVNTEGNVVPTQMTTWTGGSY